MYLAYLVDGKRVSVPLVLDPITGGAVEITGNFAEDTATELATALSGQLPVPLRPLGVPSPGHS